MIMIASLAWAFVAGAVCCGIFAWPLAYKRGLHAAERRLDDLEDVGDLGDL
jgi:hypothetical protein